MKASRLLSLPPYLFEELENRYTKATAAGRDVIDLSVGDPDLAPPDALSRFTNHALERAKHHRYPPQRGSLDLKAAIRGYLKRRCGVAPADDEILILIGSKEGIAHLPLAVCNPGDRVLVPDPGYPVYAAAAQFAGCEVVRIPLFEDRRFVPDMDELRTQKDVRLCFLNYPNNPTSATATPALFKEVLEFAADHDTIIANDAAYADVYFDDHPPNLLCGEPDALTRPMIEFFSFSKSYSVTGWRVGFAVGRRDIIDALAHLKANIDSGVFGAIQEAVALTLDSDDGAYENTMRREYQRRRDVAHQRLDKLGFHCFKTCATFYVWVRVPSPWQSMDYALHLLDKADVLLTPGTGFGDGGEGFFRIALTQPVERIEEALDRISRL